MGGIPKADYSEISKIYDEARQIDRNILDLWLGIIKEMVEEVYGSGAGHGRNIRFLDIGGGTGRWALPIAERLGYSVTCSDASKEMIAKGVEKDVYGYVNWDIQNAQEMTYSDDSFDVVFISHLLHHVERPFNVIRESYRVLRPGGLILNRYAPIEHIINDPDHVFFPEVREIDIARIPKIGCIERWCIDAGFKDITALTVNQRTWKTAEKRLEKIRLGNTSGLFMLKQKNPVAFKRGLRRMENYLLENPDSEWFLTDRITITKGKKPAYMHGDASVVRTHFITLKRKNSL